MTPQKKFKYYNIDDSENKGIAKVEVLSTSKPITKGVFMCKIQIVEIIKPSTFIKCKVGSKKSVINRMLRDKL